MSKEEEEVKTFFVSKKAKDQIPNQIRVYKPLPVGFWEVKWSKEFSTYVLESIEEELGWLKVTYKLRK